MTMKLPCDICSEPFTGQCTKCRKFFCGQHLHYMGRNQDNLSETKLLCCDCLEKTKREDLINSNKLLHIKTPGELTQDDIQPVHDAVIRYIKALVMEEYGAENEEHRIYEAALEAFCGPKVFTILNKYIK